jgi:hypothetical protein
MTRNVLEEVCHELLACKAVGSNREFCERWLLKNESYFRVLRFHNMPPSAEALSICASKLGYYARKLAASTEPKHQHWAERFGRLQSLCVHALEQQAQAKWMTPECMGY